MKKLEDLPKATIYFENDEFKKEFLFWLGTDGEESLRKYFEECRKDTECYTNEQVDKLQNSFYLITTTLK